MKSAPTPSHEAQRLVAVRDLALLDTESEDAFDRITRMVASIMDVPTACVTIVDKDRQWFKSSVGMALRETPRSISFCGHAICSDELFIVTNARDDERFKDNPLVTGAPNIAFYVGVPVMSPDGMAVGTLCAISSEPKVPTKEQAQFMKDLAQIVESELRLRQQSLTDPLSELLNRRGFSARGERELIRAARDRSSVAAMVLDINNFKRINDNLGHDVGDDVIRSIGVALTDAIRRPGDVIGRLGGDEFALLLPGLNEKNARMFGEKIGEIVRDAVVDVLGADVYAKFQINTSIGCSVAEPAKRRPHLKEFLDRADGAMYESKQQGQAIIVRSLDAEAADA